MPVLRSLAPAFVVTAAISVALSAMNSARADTIYINNLAASSTTSTATQAMYRISNTNWDTRLTNGLTASTAANTTTFGFGNHAALNGNTYDFSLQWIAGTVNVNRGFVWTVSSGTTILSRTAFGTFSPALTGTTVAASGTLNGVTPSASFNMLGLSQRATGTNGGSQATLADLAFSTTRPGATQSGAWLNGSITTPPGGPVPPGTNGTDGFINQWMISDFDLSANDWTLTGKVTLTRGFSAGDDNATFQITARQVVPVPEPGQLAYVTAAAAMCGLWRLRRLRRGRLDGTANNL